MIHPRIAEFIQKLKDFDRKNILTIEVLELLKNWGATRTEAAIVLHQGFELIDEKADEFVIKSQVWAPQDIKEIFYETLKYLNYNPDDPDYRDDGDSIKISL